MRLESTGPLALPPEKFVLPALAHDESAAADVIHVVLDEAFDPNVAVCAVVFTEREFYEANEEIDSVATRLRQRGSLAGLSSFPQFLKNGFHATADTTEIYEQFIYAAFQTLPGKALIYYSDGTRRPDLSRKKLALLLYGCVIEVILLSHKRASKVVLHFERHEELEEFFGSVAALAARKSRSSARLEVVSCPKGKPSSLALADYILHAFGRIQPRLNRKYDATKFRDRNFKALANHISLIYSMEHKRIANRRHPL